VPFIVVQFEPKVNCVGKV